MAPAVRDDHESFVEDGSIEKLKHLQDEVRQLVRQLDRLETEFWRILHPLARDSFEKC